MTALSQTLALTLQYPRLGSKARVWGFALPPWQTIGAAASTHCRAGRNPHFLGVADVFLSTRHRFPFLRFKSKSPLASKLEQEWCQDGPYLSSKADTKLRYLLLVRGGFPRGINTPTVFHLCGSQIFNYLLTRTLQAGSWFLLFTKWLDTSPPLDFIFLVK